MAEQQDTETPRWYGIDAETGERYYAPPSLDGPPQAA